MYRAFFISILILQTLYAHNFTNKTIHPVPNLTTKEIHEVMLIVSEVEKKWLDEYGFMRLNPSLKKDIINENPVLFTSEYLYLLWRLGVLKGKLRDYYKKKILVMIDQLRLEPGLFGMAY